MGLYGKILFSGLVVVIIGTAQSSAQAVSGSSQNNAERGRIDRTIPNGITRADYDHMTAYYRSLPPEARKTAATAKTYIAGDRETFWVQSSEQWVQITAECRKVAAESYVFVEIEDAGGNPVLAGTDGGYVSQTDADNVAAEFSSIYGKVRAAFGNEVATGPNGETKIVLLLLDIDDTLATNPESGVNTAGYFYSVDLMTETVAVKYDMHSNERKILYIDTFPSIDGSNPPTTNHTDDVDPNITSLYGTLAHEFQHMVHNGLDENESTWVNEGCSGLAEFICGYGIRKPENLAPSGGNNSLVDWTGSLIDYEQVALFFLYLYERYGGGATIKSVAAQKDTSVAGIDAVLALKGYAQRMKDVFNDWSVTNLVSANAGVPAKYHYTGIDLGPYPFAPAATHATYPANGGGLLAEWSNRYVEFKKGLPLSLVFSATGNLAAPVVSLSSDAPIVSTVDRYGKEFSGFGTSVTGIILAEVAHTTQVNCSYFTQPVTVKLTYPSASGVTLTSGSVSTITWQGFSGTGVTVELYKGGVLDSVLFTNTANDGSESWTVPSGKAPGSDYRIRVFGTGTALESDWSDAAFAIAAPTAILPPTGVAVSDVSGDNGHYLKLTWKASASEQSGLVARYRIYRSRVNTLGTIIPQSKATSLDSLKAWELRATILVDSVAAGVTTYTDAVPVNGVNYYYWLQAVGSSGASRIVATDAPLAVREQPSLFSLGRAYPNPFNPATTIEYIITEEMRVSIAVHSVTGQRVAVLRSGIERAGGHSVVWNASGFPSGVYFYTISAGGHTATGKVMLLK